MAGKPHVPRNYTLSTGVSRYSASQLHHKRGTWAKKNKGAVKKQIAAPIVKKFGKEGKESRTIAAKGPSFYPTEDNTAHQVAKKKRTQTTPKLRSSIKPGQILILLAGRFRGRRVVFLKQLTSGLLLITGPFKINGVPLRRVNQAFVIATSTQVDVASLKVDEKFNDAYFAKPEEQKKKKSEEEFFSADKKEKTPMKPERVQDQKTVDASILEAVKKDSALTGYLASKFYLTSNQVPHLMKF